jgi:hypothetical protein
VMEGIRGCTALYIGSSYQNRTIVFHLQLWGSPREEVQMKMYICMIIGEHCLTFCFFSISIQKDPNNHAESLLQKGAMCMYSI